MTARSGNSLTFRSASNGKSSLTKEFSRDRAYQFYRELFMMRYLSALSENKSYVPAIQRVERERLRIVYEQGIEVEKSGKALMEYVCLVREVSILVSQQRSINELTLAADQPLLGIGPLIAGIKKRLNSLTDLRDRRLTGLLHGLHKLIEEAGLRISNIDLHTSLTFSHADSGIHNAIRDRQGNMLLIDLEYAGMDSPIKQVFDIILHPKNQKYTEYLPSVYSYFLDEIVNELDKQYLPTIGAILSVKWAIISLNEYLPEKWRLRTDADPNRKEIKGKILEHQLSKAVIYYDRSCELLRNGDGIIQFTESQRNILSCSF